MENFVHPKLDDDTFAQLDEFHHDYLKMRDEIEDNYVMPDEFFAKFRYRSYEPVSTETLRTRLTAIKDAAEKSLEILEKAEAGEPVEDIAFTNEEYSSTTEEIVTYNAKNKRSENIEYFPDRYSKEEQEQFDAQLRAWSYVCEAGSQHWAMYYNDILEWEKIKKTEEERNRMLQERGLVEAYEITRRGQE